MVHFGLFLTILLAYIQNGLALRCWACSSDLDPSCMDPFNSTKILQFRNNYNQAYGNQPYNNNNNNNNPYNNQYNNNNQYGNNPYNNQYGNNNNNNQFRNDIVNLRDCQGDLNQIYGTKQMCVKKVINVPYGKRIITRECKSVSTSQLTGTCPDRSSNIEFCEYCDYDGCNSATGLKASLLLLPCALAVFLRR